MKNKELSPKYDSNLVEKNKYENWIKNGYFKADINSLKPPFSIILPPPNVTGKLHLGHAWDGSLQDAIIRFKKLNGFDTLYLPGMDHAGIATQTKVESKLKEQDLTRHDLGRDKFLKEVWKWKNEYAQTIRQQWAKMGLALDYSLENFTFNPEINKLVNSVFVSMFEKGLIYKDKKIINWDPKQKTALSNIEVIYKEVEGKMFYFKYVIEGTNDFLEVATTRPETMFADQCLVVNPNDQRYLKFVGKKVINPVNNNLIPVITDDYVEIDFGTGVMKCTPAHDPNDFEIGKRHNLAQPICMNEDGTINELGGANYNGLDRFAARKKIIINTKKMNTFIKEEAIKHQVGFSERTDTIVEPYLSNQWFVKMKTLAQEVLNLQNSNQQINFFPERFNKVLEKWMTDAYDWTISRQLWWGHQIPAYYNKKTKQMIVSLTPPVDLENWEQDTDVLDTWFSSALWPFATLKWEATKFSEYFERYYPTNVLVTGYDIIFFWVARMIFQGLVFTGKKPFKDVLIHGLVRDEQGQKMSKSLGNGIDPMDLINQYGVDSLRFFLLTNSTPGQDIKYSEEKIRSSWNFMNKLWNASRYLLMNIGDNFEPQIISNETLLNKESDVDRWILNEFNKLNIQVSELINKYEFAIAGKLIYDFVWTKYCSWYIEFAKVNLASTNLSIVNSTKQTLFYVLKQILIILHPFTPFITEEIYCKMNLKNSIMLEQWCQEKFNFETEYINYVVDLISAIREFRNSNNIKNVSSLNFTVTNLNDKNFEIFKKNFEIINEFLKSFVNSEISFENLNTKDVSSISINGYFLEILNSQFINKEELFKELQAKKIELEQEIKRSEKMLNNSNFVEKASSEKIALEKDKYKSYKEHLLAIEQKLQNL
ncbi:valyl-tRNA synthetase [Williamsoniiplasma somnilux]|uniref:Valine--tRNA ligase n=1 Tax=Williamsoniiplasma somnilux TaxID=215578 RepID=A0A2K8NY69_9MOLU|nr:valine--tRNA ligase [Williamsoniiplasma somnilux]ATZ18769.1 valyl-tRNA synthetase [Williamsoniiplasma somnilux]